MSKLPTTHKTKAKKKQLRLAVLERKLLGHTHEVYVAVSPNGKWLASCSKDKTVKFWDLATGKCKATKEHTEIINCVAFLPDGRLLFGDHDGCISLLENMNGPIVKVRHFPEKNIWRLVPLTDGESLVSGGGRGYHVERWHLFTRRDDEWHRYGLHINALAVVEEQSLVICGHTLSVTLLSLNSGETVVELTGHTHPVWSLAVTPDGALAISGSGDSTLRVWDLQTHACVGTLEGHQDGVNSSCFSLWSYGRVWR